MVCKVVFQVQGYFVTCVCMNGCDDYYNHDPYSYDGKIAGDVITELEHTLDTLKARYVAHDPSDTRPFLAASLDWGPLNDFQEYLEAFECLIATARDNPTAQLVCV